MRAISRPSRWRRWRYAIGAVAAAAVSAGIGFTIASYVSDDPGAAAQDQPVAPPSPGATWPPYPPGQGPGRGPAFVDPPGPDVTPIPGATPDTTQPWWHVPYVNQDQRKPLFSGEINGITILPNGLDFDFEFWLARCKEITRTPVEAANGSPLTVQSKYMPEGAMRERAETDAAFWCDGEAIAAAGGTYFVPGDEAKGRHGGWFMVFRFRGEPVAVAAAPADRWEAGTVAGHPAAIARPILPIGLGGSAVVIYANGAVTRITGENLPIEELLKFAEGLY